MYMFVEPHLPNDMFPYTCMMTLPLWKTTASPKMYIHDYICTVPNISLHTITVLPLTIVYFMIDYSVLYD